MNDVGLVPTLCCSRCSNGVNQYCHCLSPSLCESLGTASRALCPPMAPVLHRVFHACGRKPGKSSQALHSPSRTDDSREIPTRNLTLKTNFKVRPCLVARDFTVVARDLLPFIINLSLAILSTPTSFRMPLGLLRFASSGVSRSAGLSGLTVLSPWMAAVGTPESWFSFFRNVVVIVWKCSDESCICVERMHPEIEE